MPRRRHSADARTSPATAAVVRLPESEGSESWEGYVLLRIPVVSATWAEQLPPLPRGVRVTAAFSDVEVAAEHADAVSMLGYEPVGVIGTEQAAAAVDLLVPRSACDRWPLWRDQLLASGGRVWDLSFGPVAAMLGPAVAVHHRALAG